MAGEHLVVALHDGAQLIIHAHLYEVLPPEYETEPEPEEAVVNLEMAVLFAQSTGISRTQCMNALSKTKLPDDADVDLIIDSIFKNLNF